MEYLSWKCAVTFMLFPHPQLWLSSRPQHHCISLSVDSHQGSPKLTKEIFKGAAWQGVIAELANELELETGRRVREVALGRRDENWAYLAFLFKQTKWFERIDTNPKTLDIILPLVFKR